MSSQRTSRRPDLARCAQVRARIWSAVPAILIAMSLACPALALDPTLSLRQAKHTAWGVDRGAPSSIVGISQSPDGFLWLASGEGLFRFDGVTFEQIPPIPGDGSRSRQLTAVLAARNGDVWVGYSWGGVAVYRNGRLQDANPDPATGSVVALREAPDGSIWFGRHGIRGVHIFQRVGGRFEPRGETLTRTLHSLGDFNIDAQGRLWVVRDATVFAPLPGGRYREIAVDGAPLLPADASGRLWIVTRSAAWLAESRRPTGQAPDRAAASRGLGSCALVDREGNLLTCDRTMGIGYRRRGALARSDSEVFGPVDGLSGQGARAAFEDREGNVWVGTSSGLDQFRNVNLIAESPKKPLADTWVASFAPVRGGRLAGLDVEGLVELAGGGLPRRTLMPLPSGTAIRDFCADGEGGAWVFSATELRHFPDPRPVPPVVTDGGPWENRACEVDGQGRLWVSVAPRGILRLEGKTWRAMPPVPTEPTRWSLSLRTDAQGRVLVIFPLLGLFRQTDTGFESVGDMQRLGVGFIRSVTSVGDVLYIGGENGVARVDAAGVRRISAERHNWLESVGSILLTQEGETWINAARGIARLRTADFDQAFTDPTRRLVPEVFGAADGYVGTVRDAGVYSSHQAPDGRIWFRTNSSSLWLDPARLRRNLRPPNLVFKALWADGRRYPTVDGVQLPQGVRNLQIDYTALSLAVPERVRFRYRLVGADKTWIDPGQRRQAFYTNLRPGEHRFEVSAANNDGVWSPQPATLAFRIQPAFWQTWPFFVVLGVLTLAGLWGLYTLRVRQLSSRFRMLLEERLAERERIARELHDTLLQGFQGLMMRFQAVAEQMPSRSRARGLLSEALDRADAVLIEGRDRVRALRDTNGEIAIAERLESTAHRLRIDRAIEVVMEVEGEARPLTAVASDEVLAIATEAIFNAYRHADPCRLAIRLSYGANDLRLRIADDGAGFDPAVLAAAERSGHYGLVGMRERAQRLRGHLAFRNLPDGGAEVSLSVPAKVAYSDPKAGRLWSWPRLKS